MKESKQKSNFKIFETVFGSLIKYTKYLFIIAFLFIALSGIYKVDSGEVAIVLRFGKLVGQTQEQQIKQPGLHIAFPFIIDEVIKIPVEKVQEQMVTTHFESAIRIGSDITSNGYLLTGDNNIVLINSKVKYKIKDPLRYALFTNDISNVIDGIVSAESTALIAKMDIDSVLTTEKGTMGNTLKTSVQQNLDYINCGIEITNVELTSIIPPEETSNHFQNVNAAKINKQTLLQKANQYRNSKLPQAEAEASALIEEAMIKQQNALIITNAEMSEFYGLYDQYLENPESIKNGVFRERVSVILASSGAVIIVPEDGTPPIMILP